MALLLPWILVTCIIIPVICADDTYYGNNSNLVQVPNDIPVNVTVIVLTRNAITSDNFYISSFPKLWALELSGNKLSEFPDLFNVRSTLKNLHLDYTMISL